MNTGFDTEEIRQRYLAGNILSGHEFAHLLEAEKYETEGYYKFILDYVSGIDKNDGISIEETWGGKKVSKPFWRNHPFRDFAKEFSSYMTEKYRRA